MMQSSPDTVFCVINADDLGISQEVNDRIFQLMDQGHIRSATVIMNGATVDNAIARTPAYPHCSFGIHLNITYGTPLTHHHDLTPILDSHGQFSEKFPHDHLTRPVQQAVVAEWSAQIECALAMGLPISHLDSHHHVHRIPALFSSLTRVQKHYGIHRLRGSWTIFPEEGDNYPRNHMDSNHKTRTTQAFTAFYTFMQHFGNGHSQPSPKTWELMTHPGSPYDGDSTLLQESWQQKLCFPVEIVSFYEL